LRFRAKQKPPRADQNNAVVVVVPLALIVPFAPVVLESGVILALPVLTALNAALATNGIAKQQSNTKNNIIILCLLVGSTLELRLPSLSSQCFVGKASYFLGMGGVRATTVIVAAICVSLHHRWKVRPPEPEKRGGQRRVVKKWDDKHRLFKRFKTRSAPEYFAIRVK
jgi:hypothetical protein